MSVATLGPRDTCPVCGKIRGYFHDAPGECRPPAPRNGTAQPTELDQARASRYAARALAEEVSAVLSAPMGARNDTLNRAAFNLGTLVGAGHLAREDVEAQLEDAALAVGLEPGETAKTLASGLRSGLERPRVVQVREQAPDVREVPAAELTGEADFWEARALLAHLHAFARARRVSPWAVLGVTLARIITATPYAAHLPALVGGRGSLNLFVGLVGPSGAGKGGAEGAAADALDVGHLRVARLASGEAIAHVFKRRGRGSQEPDWRDESHAALITVAEVDRLAGQQARQGSTIMADLRSAWSGEQLGQVAADASRSIPLEAHAYRLCLVAGIQPHRAGALLDDSDGGTPQRFLWLPVVDADAPDVAPEQPTPLAWEPPALTRERAWAGAELDVCALARDTIDAARLARLRGEGEALDGHALLARLKVAAALGIAEGRWSVTDEDWHLAGVIAERSSATRAGVVAALERSREAVNRGRGKAEEERAQAAADHAEQRVARRIVARLRTLPSGEWLSGGDLRNTMPNRDRPHFTGAAQRLIDAGQVEQEEGRTRGSARYRLA